VSSTLGEILSSIEAIEFRAGGSYSIFIPCEQAETDELLRPDTVCGVYFITREQDEQGLISPVLGMCEMLHVSLAQEVVRAARWQKPQCTAEELVHCLNYYLDNDAFYDFQ
jgi:hypothetical protein